MEKLAEGKLASTQGNGSQALLTNFVKVTLIHLRTQIQSHLSSLINVTQEQKQIKFDYTSGYKWLKKEQLCL